jgi:hypothetical protein
MFHAPVEKRGARSHTNGGHDLARENRARSEQAWCCSWHRSRTLAANRNVRSEKGEQLQRDI